MYQVATLFQPRRHCVLERRIYDEIALVGNVPWHHASLRIGQKRFQRSHSEGLGASEVDIVGAQVGEHMALPFRSGNQNVQPPFPALIVERPEVHGDVPGLVASVADADEDDVALVALHVLQVLHEEGLVWVGAEKRLAGRVLNPQLFQLVQNGLNLRCAEGGYSQSQVRTVPRVLHHRLSDRFRFHPVGPAAASIVDRVRQVMEPQPQAFPVGIRAWKNDQAVFVELAVGQRNQGLVLAAIMPPQPGLTARSGRGTFPRYSRCRRSNCPPRRRRIK